jgi:polyhydroxybutyrate depolymerase
MKSGIGCMVIAIGLLGCMASMPAHDMSGAGSYQVKTDERAHGLRRSYRVHVPSGYSGAGALPLIVVVHGAFSTAKEMEKHSGFSELADREGFVVVYPEGFGLLGFLQHWNSGHCCGKALKSDLDDVGFIARVIDDVSARLKVDRSRIYMVGNSNGGMLTYRFAAERSDTVAAIAVVAGAIGGKPSAGEAEWRIPQPARPVPLIVFHGLNDQAVPYAGGRSLRKRHDRTFVSVSESLAFWVKNNGCMPAPRQQSLYDGRVTLESWSGCMADGGVVLYSLADWDHLWPGKYFTQRLGDQDSLRGFDAAQLIWQFFKRHRREPQTSG